MTDIDLRNLVARITKTTDDRWAPFSGKIEGHGTEQWFIEDGDFGPYDEDVADMIREGYVAAPRWNLTTDVDMQEDDAARDRIAELVAQGFTSGYEPTWSIEIRAIEPRRIYVCLTDDDVVVSEPETGLSYSASREALADDMESGEFRTDQEFSPKP